MDLLGTSASDRSSVPSSVRSSSVRSSSVRSSSVRSSSVRAASGPAGSVPETATAPTTAGAGVLARWAHRARVVLLDATVRLPGERAAAHVAAAHQDDLAASLDDLAHRVADVEHAWASRAVLAELVRRLEHLTGVPRTASAPDPVVVLQRRFDHAHRLLREDARGLTAADVRALHRGFDTTA